MLTLVAGAATSGWEVATSVGTIGAAVVTLFAVATALWQGAKDRKAADDALNQQLEAARHARQRDHEIDLLLSLSKQVVAVSVLTSGTTEMREARLLGRALAHALPDADAAVPTAVKVFYEDDVRHAVEQALTEIAGRVVEIAKS